MANGDSRGDQGDPPNGSGKADSPDGESRLEAILHRRDSRGMFSMLRPDDRQLYLPFIMKRRAA